MRVSAIFNFDGIDDNAITRVFGCYNICIGVDSNPARLVCIPMSYFSIFCFVICCLLHLQNIRTEAPGWRKNLTLMLLLAALVFATLFSWSIGVEPTLDDRESVKHHLASHPSHRLRCCSCTRPSTLVAAIASPPVLRITPPRNLALHTVLRHSLRHARNILCCASKMIRCCPLHAAHHLFSCPQHRMAALRAAHHLSPCPQHRIASLRADSLCGTAVWILSRVSRLLFTQGSECDRILPK